MDQRKFTSFSPAAFVKHPSARRLFSSDEDSRLKALVAEFGDTDWKLISREMGDRSPRQCRERYKNYLSPHLSNTPWSSWEDNLLCQKYAEMGAKWAQMTAAFIGRSDVALKTRWIALNTRASLAPPPFSSESPLASSADQCEKPLIERAEPEVGLVEPSSPRTSKSDANEFSIAQLLWTSADRTNALKSEISIEHERPESTFPNYGGKLW
jgi:hypothetical protein